MSVRNRPGDFEFGVEPTTKTVKTFNQEIVELRKQEEELMALKNVLTSRQ